MDQSEPSIEAACSTAVLELDDPAALRLPKVWSACCGATADFAGLLCDTVSLVGMACMLIRAMFSLDAGFGRALTCITWV